VWNRLIHMAVGDRFESVLEAARSGDGAAWTLLYRDLAPAVLGYLRMHGAPDAEDITSEVFVSMVRRLADFEGTEESKFRSWVFVIAHRRMLDERRRRARHPEDSAPQELLDRYAGDVENEALQALAITNVRSYFADLSPDQRDVLLLRIVADLSIEDVAKIVGRSTTAVKALQRRGLARLKRLLAEEAVTQ
jgi:RNA polymerase sigma factor (sigma-70 family)